MRAACLVLSVLLLGSVAACTSDDSGGGGADTGLPDGVDDAAGDDAAGDAGPGDAGGDDAADADTAVGPPDPGFIHVRKAETPVVAASATYVMDEPTLFRTEAALPDLDVRALAVVGGTVWAGTETGLYRFDAEAQAFAAFAETPDPGEGVRGIARSKGPGGRLVTLRFATVALTQTTSGEVEQWPLGRAPVHAVATDGFTVWVGGTAGLFTVDETGMTPAPGFAGGVAAVPEVRGLAVDAQGVVWAAGPTGLYRYDAGSTSRPWEGDARAVVATSNGVFAATEAGVVQVDAEGVVTELNGGLDGLPRDDGRAIGAAPGLVAVGWGIGASALQLPAMELGDAAARTLHYYTSLRWLPAEEVQALAVAPDGTIWVGTAEGVSRIAWVERTLAEVAGYHQQLLDDHFWRMDGFVSSDATMDDPWEPTVWSRGDKDNDGLWTQMMVGGWAYATAATGQAAGCLSAKKALGNMLMLVDLPAVTFQAAGLARGFVSRSLVRDDEGAVFESKKTQANWHLVTWEGRDYYWKDDTSSDEYAGHFFGWPLYYDLCATGPERETLAGYAADVMDYVIAGGFYLLDLDGEQTTHGEWAPEELAIAVDGLDACTADILDCLSAWGGHGWLNSLEILGHLLATWHMTGEPRFLDAYEQLVTVHRYDEVATPHDETATITFPTTANHSDHELAMLAYATLIRYEPDDARRQLWIDGLLFLYGHELDERNPLWAAFVSLAAGPEHAELGPALQSLREMPLDRREPLVDNTHRLDAIDWPDDRHGDDQWDRVFPYDEIRTVWWNGNLHTKADGGNLKNVSGPMAWLLPYWALRYANVVGP